jgi:hypothetical protein
MILAFSIAALIKMKRYSPIVKRSPARRKGINKRRYRLLNTELLLVAVVLLLLAIMCFRA